MLRKLYCLLGAILILSCKEQDVESRSNGYLIVKEVYYPNNPKPDYPVFPSFEHIPDSSVTSYNYEKNGSLKDIAYFGEKVTYTVNESNLGSMTKPYVTATSTAISSPLVTYYCDENKRVIREVSSYGSETQYFYNALGLIEMKVRSNTVHLPDTTWYSYNVEISDGKILKGSYTVDITNYKQTGMSKWERVSNSRGDYVFNEEIEIKGWVEYPFHFGLRHNKALQSSSFVSENYSINYTYDYNLDSNGLIVERRFKTMENEGPIRVSSTKYSYAKL